MISINKSDFSGKIAKVELFSKGKKKRVLYSNSWTFLFRFMKQEGKYTTYTIYSGENIEKFKHTKEYGEPYESFNLASCPLIELQLRLKKFNESNS